MARKRKLDFTGVEEFVKCDEGQHVVKLVSIDEEISQAGNDMLNATFQVVKGNSTGAKIYDNFVLTEKALWKLKGFLGCIGMKNEGKLVLDLDAMIGKTCIADVFHEEYQGKTRSKISNYKKLGASKPAEEEEDYDDEEEDDTPPPPKAKKAAPPATKAKKKPPVEEDEDEDDDWGDED